MNLLPRDEFERRHPAKFPYPTELTMEPRKSLVLRGNVTIDHDTALSAVIGGDVLIKRDGEVSFRGVIKGTLTIEPGATVFMNGVVRRNLDIFGSALLEGVVGKDVRVHPGAELHIAGVVKGRVRERH